jgi:adenylate cyclase
MSELLVVDDNPVNRDLLSRRLIRAGYSVSVAAGGQEAINLLVSQTFDLLLLDVMMPDMDGITVLGLLRRTYSMSDLPVIMVTARDETDDVVAALEQGANDYITKPINFPIVLARVQTQLAIKQSSDRIKELVGELELKNEFIRSIFGRYVSSEVVENLLDRPEGLGFKGVHRQVSILIADLRGFTLLADSLPADEIVRLLNNYLEEMIEIIGRYGGTIAEIVGDGVLAFFGAPVEDRQHALHAVACAVDMQQSMHAVNLRNRESGLPELQMGIGINSGEGVVGNIGSQTRSKYAVVGSVVNLASRIESGTAGGQIVISESTLAEVGAIVRIDGQRTIQPKGARRPVNVYEVSGIGGDYNLFIERDDIRLLVLNHAIPVECTLVEGKQVGTNSFDGQLVKLSRYSAQLQSAIDIEIYSDLRIQLQGNDGHLYGKVLEKVEQEDQFVIRFSSLSPDASDMITSLIGQPVHQ